MKTLFIYLFIIISAMTSCQDKKDFSQKNNNKNNIMNEKFDFKLYKKYQSSNGTLKLENGNTILSMSPPSPNEIGIQTELLPKPSFLYYYKEFFPNGNIKKKELKFSETVKLMKSEHYAENGTIEKTVDEDKTYRKIKYKDVLNFLDSKGYIDLRTGEGRLNEDGTNKYDVDYDPTIPAWKILITQGKRLTEKELFDIMNSSGGEPNPWKPIVYQMNGETGKVEELK